MTCAAHVYVVVLFSWLRPPPRRPPDQHPPRPHKRTAINDRLPYLERCIKETLRLYPVAINLSRVALRDTTLGGYRINKGAVVSVRGSGNR